MVSKYAQVSDGKVQNIAVFATREDAIRITRAIYGDASEALNVDYVDVRLGSEYIDGKFYNVDEDGAKTPAETRQTEVQRIDALEAAQDDLTLTIASIIGGED